MESEREVGVSRRYDTDTVKHDRTSHCFKVLVVSHTGVACTTCASASVAAVVVALSRSAALALPLNATPHDYMKLLGRNRLAKCALDS